MAKYMISLGGGSDLVYIDDGSGVGGPALWAFADAVVAAKGPTWEQPEPYAVSFIVQTDAQVEIERP